MYYTIKKYVLVICDVVGVMFGEQAEGYYLQRRRSQSKGREGCNVTLCKMIFSRSTL